MPEPVSRGKKQKTKMHENTSYKHDGRKSKVSRTIPKQRTLVQIKRVDSTTRQIPGCADQVSRSPPWKASIAQLGHQETLRP